MRSLAMLLIVPAIGCHRERDGDAAAPSRGSVLSVTSIAPKDGAPPVRRVLAQARTSDGTLLLLMSRSWPDPSQPGDHVVQAIDPATGRNKSGWETIRLDPDLGPPKDLTWDESGGRVYVLSQSSGMDATVAAYGLHGCKDPYFAPIRRNASLLIGAETILNPARVRLDPGGNIMIVSSLTETAFEVAEQFKQSLDSSPLLAEIGDTPLMRVIEPVDYLEFDAPSPTTHSISIDLFRVDGSPVVDLYAARDLHLSNSEGSYTITEAAFGPDGQLWIAGHTAPACAFLYTVTREGFIPDFCVPSDWSFTEAVTVRSKPATKAAYWMVDGAIALSTSLAMDAEGNAFLGIQANFADSSDALVAMRVNRDSLKVAARSAVALSGRTVAEEMPRSILTSNGRLTMGIVTEGEGGVPQAQVLCFREGTLQPDTEFASSGILQFEPDTRRPFLENGVDGTLSVLLRRGDAELLLAKVVP